MFCLQNKSFWLPFLLLLILSINPVYAAKQKQHEQEQSLNVLVRPGRELAAFVRVVGCFASNTDLADPGLLSSFPRRRVLNF